MNKKSRRNFSTSNSTSSPYISKRTQTMQHIVEEVGAINNVLETSAQSWRSVLPNARNVIRLLDGPPALAQTFDVDYQIYTTHVLQRLAYKEPDQRPEQDIASWCERRWATIVQSFPQDYRPAQGLGEAWLFKAQETLARIARDEGSVSSDGSYHSTTSRGNSSLDSARLNLPDYVQSRDVLRPSLEFFDRAIDLAGSQGELSGRLLTLGAEAYISFGNVSNPTVNEQFYQRALRYLDRASRVEGFVLEAHFRQFLDENIRWLE